LVVNADHLDSLEYSHNDDDQDEEGVVEDLLLSPIFRDALIPGSFYSGARSWRASTRTIW